jgi:hypothetical protein
MFPLLASRSEFNERRWRRHLTAVLLKLLTGDKSETNNCREHIQQ